MANSVGYPNVIAVRDDTARAPKDLTMPDELEGLKVALYVWDPDALDWVRMRQPQISPLADDLPMDTWFDVWENTDRLKYKSIHRTHKALTSDTGWLNWKYTWASVQVAGETKYYVRRIEGPLEGSIDNIDSLGWGT